MHNRRSRNHNKEIFRESPVFKQTKETRSWEPKEGGVRNHLAPNTRARRKNRVGISFYIGPIVKKFSGRTGRTRAPALKASKVSETYRPKEGGPHKRCNKDPGIEESSLTTKKFKNAKIGLGNGLPQCGHLICWQQPGRNLFIKNLSTIGWMTFQRIIADPVERMIEMTEENQMRYRV